VSRPPPGCGLVRPPGSLRRHRWIGAWPGHRWGRGWRWRWPGWPPRRWRGCQASGSAHGGSRWECAAGGCWAD
jgi:hypothetical protein